MGLRKLPKDRAGQVSFAVIAVVLLTASTLAGTYLAKRELDESKTERRAKLLDAMEDAARGIAQELSLYGAAKAHETVSSWASFPVNESAISEAFSGKLRDYIQRTYPRAEGRFSVEVTNWTGGLFYIEKKTQDLVPSENTTAKSLEFDGSKLEYAQLPPPSVEVLGEKTVNPYYVALGNFTVRITSGAIELAKQMSFQRPVVSALPFLESKLRAFESASDGGLSDLGSLVGYMLSTLGELRIIEGYGQPMYSGKNTSAILTEEDVYDAVAVGLVLEQARLFRDVDRSFLSQVAKLCGGSSLGALALLGSKGRGLDPAELFLWFLGKTRLEVDSKMLVAQAVFGLVDQIALKMMEYMGYMGLIELANMQLHACLDTLDSIAAYFTGEDKAQSTVVSWIERAMKLATADPASYSDLFSSAEDFFITVPERQYFVEDAAGNLYPVWVGNLTLAVDVPEYNLLSSDLWSRFYSDFKDCQSSLRSLITDSVTRLAMDFSEYSTIEIGGVSVDPTDEQDIFSSMAQHMGEVTISYDAGQLSESSRDLPMFSAQYELASRFSQFVRSNGVSLIDRDGLMGSVYSELASSIVSSARYAYIPDLGVPVEQQLEDVVRSDVEADPTWGVGWSAAVTLDALSSAYLARLTDIVNRSVVRLDNGFAGPIVDGVASLLARGADGFPGVGKLVEQQLTCFSREVLRQKELGSYKHTVRLDLDRPFEFWEGDRSAAEAGGRVLGESVSVSVDGGLPPLQVVPFDPSTGYTSLENMFPTDDLLVQVKRPWDFDRGRAEYPNLHMTSLDNVTASPYSTQWTVSVIGQIDLRLTSNNTAFQSLLSSGPSESRTSARIQLMLPIVLHSAWPLEGVGYNPTNTALSDGLAAAKKFCSVVWDKLEPVLGWLKDGLERIYRFVTDAFQVLASFATRIIKALAGALQTLVETLQDFVQKIADSALAKAVKVFLDLFGRVEFRISMYGFTIIVQTNIPDLIYRHGSDLLRLIVCTDRFGPGLAFGVRVARLTDGSYDILANATISLRKGTVEVMVDPLMHILRRFVEVHCTAVTWAMDIVMPEVEPYESASVSTSDIPGIGAFLSNIPIPVLGLSASVEAGMQLKYSPPFPKDVVVNEFESNPQGDDSGKEWVELYNPQSKPRCVDGWTLATVHGKNSALRLEGTIAPNGLLVFTFPETSIDNGDPDDPFNDGDAIVLLDPSGAIVDITPVLRDAANDDRTNQRSWDGGPRWVFRQGSQGWSNGAPVLLASSDFIAKALFEAFKDAFLQTQLQEVTASLDFITLFAKRVLSNFIENLLSLVKEIVHEIVFYIQVGLSDASGSAGVGFRASFVITGEAVVDLIRWLIHTFATFVVNLGRASHPMAYPAFPRSFFSGLYLSFEVLFEVGLPRMVRLLGAVGDLNQRFALVVGMSPNIPALGKIIGKNWGNWSVEFGAYVEGVPREFVSGFLAADTGKLIDFWLLRGRAYGL